MKIDDLVTSDYLKEADVTPPIRVTIKSTEAKNMSKPGEAPQIKCVVSFEEIEKKLVCNVTNFKAIVKKTGQQDSDNWAGHQIDLWFNPDIEFGGEQVGGIRLITAQPQTPIVPQRQERTVPQNEPLPKDTTNYSQANDDIPF